MLAKWGCLLAKLHLAVYADRLEVLGGTLYLPVLGAAGTRFEISSLSTCSVVMNHSLGLPHSQNAYSESLFWLCFLARRLYKRNRVMRRSPSASVELISFCALDECRILASPKQHHFCFSSALRL